MKLVANDDKLGIYFNFFCAKGISLSLKGKL